MLLLLQEGPGSTIYYTDGSADPVYDMMRVAAVTDVEVLTWRMPDHCSALQTELVAIQHTLEHT